MLALSSFLPLPWITQVRKYPQASHSAELIHIPPKGGYVGKIIHSNMPAGKRTNVTCEVFWPVLQAFSCELFCICWYPMLNVTCECLFCRPFPPPPPPKKKQTCHVPRGWIDGSGVGNLMKLGSVRCFFWSFEMTIQDPPQSKRKIGAEWWSYVMAI